MSIPYSLAIVGAGFSGCVLARQLAEAGHNVTVFDSRAHVGGNCHTARDKTTGIMVHTYGPHIFHTDDTRVWEFITRFGDMCPYNHRVKAITGNKVYSLPVNLLTINQFFGTTFSPAEAMAFIQSKSIKPKTGEAANFEEQALYWVGQELYEAFFRSYTLKQWGMDPVELPAAILKRLPLRFNYDDSYFNHRYQAIPREGYTPIMEKMLEHRSITLHLDTRFDQALQTDFDHVFYSGPLDAWFDHALGPLPYRTLDFTRYTVEGDYQGTAVMNYCDASVDHTRITEHKHFAPWETHQSTVCYREYSRLCQVDDIPYYPIRLAQETALLQAYVALAKKQQGITFMGRLGTYRYLDMDVTIKESLAVADRFLSLTSNTADMPAFVIDPLA